MLAFNAAQTESVIFAVDGLVHKTQTPAVLLTNATVPPDFPRYMENDASVARIYAQDSSLTLPGVQSE